MAFFISTVNLSKRGVVLEIPTEGSGEKDLPPDDEARPPDIARWLKDHSDHPVVILSACSGAEALEELNRTNRFGYQVLQLDELQTKLFPDQDIRRNETNLRLQAENARFEREIREHATELNALKRQLAVAGEQRARAQEALRKSRQQLSLTSSILHDVNNLLLVIYFSSRQALAHLADTDPNRTPLIAIQNARTQATELTRRLRTVLATEPYEAITVDLNHLIVHSEQIFRRLIRGNVIMTVTLSPTPATVNADSETIDQMIHHLMMNALSAIPEGGWVTIETGHDEIASTDFPKASDLPPGRYVYFSVSDTGSGVKSEARLPHLRQRTERAHSPEPAESALATVDQIVTRYGGRLDVMSSAETGTKIEIRLPAATEIPVFRPFIGETELQTGTETVLVVEDEAYIRKYITITLEAHGYRVLEAEDANAAEAIGKRATEPIDLLLIDSILPGVSGRDVAKTFWKAHPDLPVIFMSGLMKDEVVADIASNASIAFLQKPFATNELLTVVRKSFDERVKSA